MIETEATSEKIYYGRRRTVESEADVSLDVFSSCRGGFRAAVGIEQCLLSLNTVWRSWRGTGFISTAPDTESTVETNRACGRQTQFPASEHAERLQAQRSVCPPQNLTITTQSHSPVLRWRKHLFFISSRSARYTHSSSTELTSQIGRAHV